MCAHNNPQTTRECGQPIRFSDKLLKPLCRHCRRP